MTILVDQGTAFVSRELGRRADQRAVVLGFFRLGKPTNNGSARARARAADRSHRHREPSDTRIGARGRYIRLCLNSMFV